MLNKFPCLIKIRCRALTERPVFFKFLELSHRNAGWYKVSLRRKIITFAKQDFWKLKAQFSVKHRRYGFHDVFNVRTQFRMECWMIFANNVLTTQH